jgi:hypothetical protein
MPSITRIVPRSTRMGGSDALVSAREEAVDAAGQRYPGCGL